MPLTPRQRKYLKGILRTRSSPCGTGFLVAAGIIILGGILQAVFALLSRNVDLFVASLFVIAFAFSLVSVYCLFRDFTAIILSLAPDGDPLADETAAQHGTAAARSHLRD